MLWSMLRAININKYNGRYQFHSKWDLSCSIYFIHNQLCLLVTTHNYNIIIHPLRLLYLQKLILLWCVAHWFGRTNWSIISIELISNEKPKTNIPNKFGLSFRSKVMQSKIVVPFKMNFSLSILSMIVLVVVCVAMGKFYYYMKLLSGFR